MKYRVLKAYSPLIYSICLLIAVVVFSYTFTIFGIGKNPSTANTTNSSAVAINAVAEEKTKPVNGEYYSIDGEMRAVWVPYMTLSIENTEHTQAVFEEHFNSIVETAKEYGMNTLIVQIRPFSDALYPSEYFPLSHIITGTQGDSIDYDPLKYMVNACHNADLEFHAWINPYRIKVSETPKELCESNPYTELNNSDDKIPPILEWEDNIYYNPASVAARELIINGVREIVKNYAVDAIQFDDYFYPTTSSDYDSESYTAYTKGVGEDNIPLTLTAWRSANVNALVSGVYAAIHSISDYVDFGISPQGNIENDINMGADVYTWCSQGGYIDYICPQIYYNFDNPVLPYDKAVDKWKDILKVDNIKLYVGLGVYKAGSDDDEGTWKDKDDILQKQIEYARQNNLDGFMLYSYDYLTHQQTKAEIANVMSVL